MATKSKTADMSMESKVVLITGATSGIGKATAVGIAKMGATVVLMSRDRERGEDAEHDIRRLSGNDDVHMIFCDLASFDSIRRCCDEFRIKFGRLDVLINNAGVWDFKRKESEDGIERTLAVNFLAPFLMTNLLLDMLRRSAPSRIVNVASALHLGKVNFDDIELKKSFSGFSAYSQSKLCVILFTRLLAMKLKGTGVTANCMHPGMVNTNLGRDSGTAARSFLKLFGASPEKGARTSIYLASSPDVRKVSGEYFANQKPKASSRESYDMEVASRLWEVAEKYVGMAHKG
jgi:NAD(P)-dependent dehydrogenase (short-subunit alcohol dehydrogenase family)